MTAKVSTEHSDRQGYLLKPRSQGGHSSSQRVADGSILRLKSSQKLEQNEKLAIEDNPYRSITSAISGREDEELKCDDYLET